MTRCTRPGACDQPKGMHSKVYVCRGVPTRMQPMFCGGSRMLQKQLARSIVEMKAGEG